MSNFIDYSRRGRRGTPSPEASIANDNSTRQDDPFSDRGESEAPQSEIVAANPYGSPFAQNHQAHHGGHGGEHIDVEHVHTMGETTQPQQDQEPFFDPSFPGE